MIISEASVAGGITVDLELAVLDRQWDFQHQACHLSHQLDFRPSTMEFSTRHLVLCSCIYLSGCGQFKQVETSQNCFLMHMTNRKSMAYHVTSALDSDKEGCATQILADQSSLLILPTRALNYCVQK